MTSLETALRVIDANLNRIGEGLRLLEDLARFILNDANLTQQLKIMRHSILEKSPAFNQQLLQSRDSAGDVGVNLETMAERELPIVAVANSRRVQESLRSIEEMAKMPGIDIDPAKFKQARFSLYSIERELVGKLTRQDKAKCITGLYVVVDTGDLKEKNPVDVARQALDSGARIVELQGSTTGKKDLLNIASQIKTLCAERNVLFIIKDSLDIALASDADGLHLSQDNIPASVARRLLPIDKVLGVSVTGLDEAVAAQKDVADYVVAGPFNAAGVKSLIKIRQAVSIPIVAVGGITLENTGEVVAAGANAVAVSSVTLNAPSFENSVRQIIARIEAG